MRGVISGAVGEVVAADIVQPLVHNLRKAKIKRDRQGKDLEFDPTPRGIRAIDAKTGLHRPAEVVSLGSSKDTLVLSIDPDHIDGFYLRPEYTHYYRMAVQDYL